MNPEANAYKSIDQISSLKVFWMNDTKNIDPNKLFKKFVIKNITVLMFYPFFIYSFLFFFPFLPPCFLSFSLSPSPHETRRKYLLDLVCELR
jgi:hypothetical protein